MKICDMYVLNREYSRSYIEHSKIAKVTFKFRNISDGETHLILTTCLITFMEKSETSIINLRDM